MTHGKLINKQTGLEISGEVVAQSSRAVDFRIDGTTVSNVFDMPDWDFVEDRKSFQEQFNELPVGTNFKLSADGTVRYIKIAPNAYDQIADHPVSQWAFDRKDKRVFYFDPRQVHPDHDVVVVTPGG